MNVETTLETDAQFAETSKSGMSALNYPAVTPKQAAIENGIEKSSYFAGSTIHETRGYLYRAAF